MKSIPSYRNSQTSAINLDRETDQKQKREITEKLSGCWTWSKSGHRCLIFWMLEAWIWRRSCSEILISSELSCISIGCPWSIQLTPLKLPVDHYHIFLSLSSHDLYLRKTAASHPPSGFLNTRWGVCWEAQLHLHPSTRVNLACHVPWFTCTVTFLR